MAKTKLGATRDAELIITVPMGEAPTTGHEAAQAHGGKVKLNVRTLHVQAQLGQEAATALLRIRNGLREKNAKLQNGRPVYTNVDALRWLLEEVATAGTM